MSELDLRFISAWGLGILGLGIILIVVVIWCHTVNQKLRYIMGILEKTDPGIEDKSLIDSRPFKRSVSGLTDRSISPIIAVMIIGAAIFFLFIIPVWLINN